MKKLWPFIFILVLSSCSTTTKKVKSFEESKDMDWIEKADFSTVNPVKYNDKEDYFKELELGPNVLAKESLARVDKGELDDFKNKDLNHALSYCYRGEFEDAFKLFDSLYKKHKEDPSYWNQLGTCYLLQDKDKMAILYYNRAKNLNKSYVPAINNLGVLYLKQGKEQKALETFKMAMNTKGAGLTPQFNYSFLNLRFGLYEKACPNFEGFLRRSPKDVDVLNALGTCELLKNNISKAISFYERIDSDFYKRADISLNYALALKVSGNSSKAKDIFEEIDKKSLSSERQYYLTVKKYLGVE